MSRARTDQQSSSKVITAAFLHPDLGLGGAERLIVDAATELAARNYKVDIYTAHYDPNRCFEETLTGTFGVHVKGSWFPRNIFNRFHALCAYIRCILIAISIACQGWRQGKRYDIIIVDQVSAAIPFLKALTSSKVLFYCHFPDLLLAKRRSALHSTYRAPLDWFEETTTGMADAILVNSKFTQRVFAQTFRRLHRRGISPAVLYPAVNIPSMSELKAAQDVWKDVLPKEIIKVVGKGPIFLSINRFERKKGIGLAIEALHEVLTSDHTPAVKSRLIIAGGYDPRVSENVQHLEELITLAQELDVRDHVLFLPSFTDAQRAALLAICTAVIYTPQDEHFGIVPLEAMASARPVLACNSGGPVESVVEGKTGFLRDPTAPAFCEAMMGLLKEGVAPEMGKYARHHVQKMFSRHAFGDMLSEIVKEMVDESRGRKNK